MQLSTGPFSYNRFDVLDEKKELPDFIKAKMKEKHDEAHAKDDDKNESKKKDDKLPAFLKKGKDKKKDDCECKEEVTGFDWATDAYKAVYENRFASHAGKDTDAGAKYAKPSKGSGKNKTYEIKGKDGKPLFSKEEVIHHLVSEEFADNEVSAEVLFNNASPIWMDAILQELYKGKHGQSDAEYQDGRSQGGKMISGDSKMSGAKFTHGSRVGDGGAGPTAPGARPTAQGRMDKGTRNELALRKANLANKNK